MHYMDETEFAKLIGLSAEVSRIIEEKTAKAPYHFNLIDELRANENAHSRILIRLLGYTDFGTYPFLQSFLSWIWPDMEPLEVKMPVFTAEKDRIDALVIEPGSYGLIIENKVHGAVDQDRQIERYIEIARRRLPNDQIYVFYLTKSGGSPSESSMTKELEEKMGERYKEINYRDHILPWLEEEALPLCRFKDTLLISALQQYIDHLNGMFHKRMSDKKMNDELKNRISRELGISENLDFSAKLKLVNDEKDKITELLSYVDEIQKETFFQILNDWESEIRSLFPSRDYISNIEKEKKNFFFTGIKLKYKDILFGCAIGIEHPKDQPYFGITMRDCTDEQAQEIKTFVSEKLQGWHLTPSARWYGYHRPIDSPILVAYEKFANDVIEKII